ncbi:hypothetical protein KCU67_g14317, partial [Aureobasidium melanogenum]
NEDEVKMSAALEEIANEHNVTVTAVALAYVMSKTINVFPLVGGRKVEHLHDNIKALTIKLSDEQIKKLEDVRPFDIGFPNNFIGVDPTISGQPSWLLGASASLAWQKAAKPIGHE